MTTPFLLHVKAPDSQASPAGRLPATSSYRIEYAESAGWRGKDWWLFQQWHDARHVWLYLVEVRTARALQVEAKLLRDDPHWVYALSGDFTCRHPQSGESWTLPQDTHQHVWSSPTTLCIDLPAGHHLFFGFSVESGWPLRYAGAPLSHLGEVPGPEDKPPQGTHPLPMNADIRACLLTLASLSPVEGMLLDTQIYQPVARLIDLAEDVYNQSANGRTAQLALVDAVRDYVGEAIQQAHLLPPLAEIARHFGVSGDYLSRIYREHYGQSLQSFIMRRRLNEAYRLLHDEGMTVSAVTYRLGFTDLSAFGKLFRKYFNKSPSEVRRR